MAEPIPNSYQEILEYLARKAEEPEHGDCFKLKVLRRPNASSQVTQYVASFTDASFSMVTNAESWLAPFAGGGLYVLHVFDGKGRRQHAVLTPAEIIGAPRPPDPRVTKSSTWLGPTLIDAPVANTGNGAIATSPFHTLAGEPSNGVPPRSVAEAGLSGLFDTSRRMDDEYRRREVELAERERRMELDALRRANEEARRASEERIRALEAKIERAAEAPKQTSPGVAEVLPAILTGIAPIVAAWFSASAEDRKRQLELERARLDAELRRAEEAAKPKPLVDPQIMEMLGRQAQRAEESAKQFGELMRAQAESSRLNLESQGVAQRSMLQTIAQVMEIQAKVGEPAKSPGIDWGKVIPGALQGLAAMARAQGAQGAPGQPPGQPGAPMVVNPQLAAPPAAVPIIPAASLNAVEDLVKQKAPPSDVMAKLKIALEDEEGKKEIEARGGLMGVFDARLGEWAQVEANGPYAEALVKELKKEKLIEGL
jgi:plasmid stabilization system protein ParE